MAVLSNRAATPDRKAFDIPPVDSIKAWPTRVDMFLKPWVKSAPFFRSYGLKLLNQHFHKNKENVQTKELDFYTKTTKLLRLINDKIYILEYYRNYLIRMERMLYRQLSKPHNNAYDQEAISLIKNISKHRKKIEHVSFKTMGKVVMSNRISLDLLWDYASCWRIKHFSPDRELRFMAEQQEKFMRQVIATVKKMTQF